MNGLDIALIVVVATAVVAGFLRGFIRQGSELIVLYIAAVLAAQYHLVIGHWLGTFFNADPAALAGVGFIIVFVWAFLFTVWIIRRVFPRTRIAVLGVFDNLLGAGVGFATGLVAICIITAIILFASAEPWVGQDHIRQALAQATGTSMLVPFVTGYSPALVETVTPWFPGGVPAIFAPFLR